MLIIVGCGRMSPLFPAHSPYILAVRGRLAPPTGWLLSLCNFGEGAVDLWLFVLPSAHAHPALLPRGSELPLGGSQVGGVSWVDDDPTKPTAWSQHEGCTSRRPDCHFDDTPFLSLLKNLLKVEGGAAE